MATITKLGPAALGFLSFSEEAALSWLACLTKLRSDQEREINTQTNKDQNENWDRMAKNSLAHSRAVGCAVDMQQVLAESV